VLSDLRNFLQIDTCNYAGLRIPLTIYYAEGSSETICYIVEDKFGDTAQNGWVLLVGDRKTYKWTLKRKLLIFPGDWHVLKNFQSIVMKVYYYVGLKEIASSSGYHGATLKSLENCTNFKRTHLGGNVQRTVSYIPTLQWRCTTHNAKFIISTSISEKHSPHHLLHRITQLVDDNNTQNKCRTFVWEMAEKDDSKKLWQ